MQEKSVLTGHLSELKQKIENGLEELKSSKELYEFKSEYLEGKKSIPAAQKAGCDHYA